MSIETRNTNSSAGTSTQGHELDEAFFGGLNPAFTDSLVPGSGEADLDFFDVPESTRVSPEIAFGAGATAVTGLVEADNGVKPEVNPYVLDQGQPVPLSKWDERTGVPTYKSTDPL